MKYLFLLILVLRNELKQLFVENLMGNTIVAQG